jgi:hypothetical protein
MTPAEINYLQEIYDRRNYRVRQEMLKGFIIGVFIGTGYYCILKYFGY